MATYIVLGQFTDQGIKNVTDTIKRAEALKEMGQKAGAAIKEVYWTIGQYDIATIVEAPDDATVTALLLNVGKLGNVRTQTLRAFQPRRCKAFSDASGRPMMPSRSGSGDLARSRALKEKPAVGHVPQQRQAVELTGRRLYPSSFS